jgi:hypothetical protein
MKFFSAKFLFAVIAIIAAIALVDGAAMSTNVGGTTTHSAAGTGATGTGTPGGDATEAAGEESHDKAHSSHDGTTMKAAKH